MFSDAQNVKRDQQHHYFWVLLKVKPSLVILVTLLSICLPVIAKQLFFFDIKAQPADQALIAFAKQSERTIIFSYELTKQYRTNRLNGYFSLQHGLNKLLRHTELEAIFSAQDKIRIQRRTTNNINIPTKTKLATNTAKKMASNQSAIEKIAIVGSRSIGRSISELPVPVDLLSHQLLQTTGQQDNGRMLQMLAPSFNFPSSSISDGTDVLKPATLRGLGPDQTLILVNGKRRHHASLLHINTSVGRGTSGVGINSIPFQSIKHIEILRDGAAAQYGSDAIAGVINIVLKDSQTEGQLTASYGQYSLGDGQNIDISLNKGFAIDQDGFFNVSFSLKDHQSTDRSGLHGSCQYSGCIKQPDGSYVTSNPEEVSANRDTFNIGDPAYNQIALAYNSELKLVHGSLYSFATISERSNESAAFFRDNISEQANPILPDGKPVIPGGYLPFIDSDITDRTITLGYKTELTSSSSFDISYSFGENEINYSTKNSINASYANMLVAQGDLSSHEIRVQMPRSADAYNIYLSLHTLNFDIQHSFDNYTLTLGAELRKDRYQVNSGEQYSYYNYTQQLPPSFLGQYALSGIQGFPGISEDAQVNEDRNVTSFYLELSSELSESIHINSAVRYDDYDGFGSTSNIKLAGLWRLTDAIKLRSSVSTGFRAPSMQQLYFNNISSQFLVNEHNMLTAEQVGTFRNDSQLAQSIGIPLLREEQSNNFSLGAVWDFSQKFSLSLDYYAIDIDDRIVISNKLSPEYSPILSQALTQANVDKAQVFINGVDTQTRGIDLISTWQHPLFQGQHTLIVAANITDTDVKKLNFPKQSVLNQLSNEQLFSAQDISIIEQWQPKDRVSINSQYQQNDWSLTLGLNRFGKYTIMDGKTQTYGAKVLTDVRFEQQYSPEFTWYAGINNVFNVTPDKNTIGNSHGGRIVDQQGNEVVDSLGVFKYSRRSAPFGFNGSYLYFGVNYHF
ncbi:TonB-dependent receptor [Thalassotalea sp. G2M2-11]|uniref:TonB-dependent receptor plug domain-containing protein n=1 Tax=Thalassotalea sp. G2M2-11 TaxID=2787627 RepID=UPI001F49ACA5|nr:TonB-dependent receptor [Thalassotalea sp. G2M2-11]